MLDGLLGKTFSAKWFVPSRPVVSFQLFAIYMLLFFFSKPLIKMTKNRIEVIKRKRRATEKFLKKDIADLLHSGLDINAYGRVPNSFLILFLLCVVYRLGPVLMN
jgi:hypothetical protein